MSRGLDLGQTLKSKPLHQFFLGKHMLEGWSHAVECIPSDDEHRSYRHKVQCSGNREVFPNAFISSKDNLHFHLQKG